MPGNDGRPGEGSRGAANDHRIADEITTDDSRTIRPPVGAVVADSSTTDPLDHDQEDHEPETVLPVLRQWREAAAASKQESEARRARVLAHKDLTDRLKEPPLRLSDPARWSGWIPPRLLAEESCAHCGASGDRRCRDRPHRARVNDSAIRRQLVEIASEAMAREGTS